jgi:hypothetical protein
MFGLKRRGMTEAEWLACEDAHPMLGHLRSLDRRSRGIEDKCSGLLPFRKGRLLGAACCRRIWPLLIDARSRHGVEVAELFADGRATYEQLSLAYSDTPGSEDVVGVTVTPEGAANQSQIARLQAQGCAAEAVAEACHREYAAEIVAYWALPAAEAAGLPNENAVLADLVRCIFGNPFRTVALDPSWITSAVVALAKVIYAKCAFDCMPILADALEEAGCTDEAILSHCRGSGPHVPGCWPLDLILAKE